MPSLLVVLLIVIVGYSSIVLPANNVSCPGYNAPSNVPSIPGYTNDLGFTGSSVSACAASTCSFFFQGSTATPTGLAWVDTNNGNFSCAYQSSDGGSYQTGSAYGHNCSQSVPICAVGYVISGSSCSLSIPSAVPCPICGSSGTAYSDNPSTCSIGDTPLTCPGLGSVHDQTTGSCFTPPTCNLPSTLSADQHSCNGPTCAAGMVWSSTYNECVGDPPICTANQHLVGDTSAQGLSHCENNPTCGVNQSYGCVAGNCGCFGAQNCPSGQSWGAVNGVYSCYGNQLAPSNPIIPPAGTPPISSNPPTPTAPVSGNPPTGGLPTPTGTESPTSPNSDGSTGPSVQGTVGSVPSSPSTSAGKCVTGLCLCKPGSGNVSAGEIVCPQTGQCLPNQYSTPSGGCSDTKAGNCSILQHYEYQSLSCVADSATNPANPTDNNTAAISERLDKLIANTTGPSDNTQFAYIGTLNSIFDSANTNVNSSSTLFNSSTLPGSSIITGLVPSPDTCQPYVVQLPHGYGNLDFDICAKLAPLREILGYFFALWLVFHLYEMIVE